MLDASLKFIEISVIGKEYLQHEIHDGDESQWYGFFHGAFKDGLLKN